MVLCVPLQNTILSVCFCQPASAPQLVACAKTQPSLPPRARVPAFQRLLDLSWLPAACWCLQDHPCSGDTGCPTVTLHIWGRERNSCGQEQQRRSLHRAGGAEGLGCDALHAVVACLAPALGLIFCLRCTQAVLGLCFQPFH